MLFALAAVSFLFLQYLHFPDVREGGKNYFLDPDSYTWLERAERVLEGPGIYVHFHPEDNYPHGYTSHWTQPFHWTLALLALAARPFYGTAREALETVGLWICPLTGVLAVLILAAWAVRRRPLFVSILALAVFMVNPFVLWTFSLGRPDHQCLLFLFLLGAVLLLLDRPSSPEGERRVLAWSAVLCAAGVWISVEALALWALLLGGLVMEAALAPPDRRYATIRAAFRWAVFAAGAALLFTVVERKTRVFPLVSDSISLGHVGLMAFAALGFVPALVAQRRGGRPGRKAWFFTVILPPLLLGAAAMAGLLALAPADPDPAVRSAMERWFADNLEFLPALFFVNGKAMLGRLHASLAFTLYALPFLLYGLHRCTDLSVRGRWILGAGIAAGSVLTLWQMRWRDLHALLAAPVLACALPVLLARILPAGEKEARRRKGRRAGMAVLTALSAFFLLFPWIRQDVESYRPGRRPRQDYVALRILCERIREIDPYPPTHPEKTAAVHSPPAEAVLAPWDAGPLVQYWSGRPVIAGPYHRDMEGILDTLRAYTARTPEAFDPLARARGVRYVLRPPLSDPLYDIYTFEEILGTKHPILTIRREIPLPGGGGTAREYALAPGATAAVLEKVLRKRLEENRWDGWPGLAPVHVPGLEDLLPDADSFPYLYRYEGKKTE